MRPLARGSSEKPSGWPHSPVTTRATLIRRGYDFITNLPRSRVSRGGEGTGSREVEECVFKHLDVSGTRLINAAAAAERFSYYIHSQSDMRWLRISSKDGLKSRFLTGETDLGNSSLDGASLSTTSESHRLSRIIVIQHFREVRERRIFPPANIREIRRVARVSAASLQKPVPHCAFSIVNNKKFPATSIYIDISYIADWNVVTLCICDERSRSRREVEVAARKAGVLLFPSFFFFRFQASRLLES